MANNGIKITAPVSITDVKQVLKIGTTNDLGTLCKAAAINMWARYKPVSIANVAPDRSKEWWKCADGMCGFSIPSVRYGYLSDIKTMRKWTYVKPSGGANSPYRLADFIGYDNNSKCPWSSTGSLIYGHYTAGNTTATINVLLTQNSLSTDNLQLSDISVAGTTLDNYYLGVIFERSGTCYLITNSNKINFGTGGSSNILSASVNDSAMSGATISVYPVLSKVAHTSAVTTGTSADSIIPLPFDFSDSITYLAARAINIIGIYGTATKGSVSWTIKFRFKYNSTSFTSRAISGKILTIRNGDTLIGVYIANSPGSFAFYSNQTEAYTEYMTVSDIPFSAIPSTASSFRIEWMPSDDTYVSGAAFYLTKE